MDSQYGDLLSHAYAHYRDPYFDFMSDTVYCKSFEVEKFRGFRGLTGDRETFPVKDFPTGNFLKNGRRHYTGERGIAIPTQLHECWIQLLWAYN